MLGGVTEYASVNSRVRALYSGMLTSQDWVRLSEAPDLAALVAALKETVYGPYLSSLEDRNLTPKRAVYEIKRHLADVYSTVIHSPPARMRNLLTQLYRHFEVGNLKAVLRGVVLDASDGAFNELLALGFLESMKKEWAWRISRGESTRNLDAFRHLLEP